MKTRNFALTLSTLALAVASFTANADILFQNLGTSAPPATVGTHAMTPFAIEPQAAIAESSSVTILPGNPFGGNLTIDPSTMKYTLGYSWGTDAWPGNYFGPTFFTGWSVSTRTLTLPPNTKAFYFYLQNNYDGNPADTITVTSNSGVTSGPILVQTGFFQPNVGANGFAFHSTADENITSITIQTDNPTGFTIANFGISTGAPATPCAREGYTGTKLNWCRIICESESSSSTIDTYLRRWINKYRDLPYCAVEGGEPPPVGG